MIREIYRDSTYYRKSKSKGYHGWLRGEVKNTRARINRVTPAARRLLITLHNLFEANQYKPVSRDAICQALGKAQLTTWERRLLHEHLYTAGFITPQHQNLTAHGGRRWVYKMDIDVGFMLAVLRKPAPNTQI